MTTGMLMGLPTAGAPVAGLVALMVTAPVQLVGEPKPVVTIGFTVRKLSVTPLTELLPPFNCNQLAVQVPRSTAAV